MTPTQKKIIHEIVTSNELDWNNFSVVSKTENNVEYSKLIHVPTELYFEFSFDEVYDGLDVGPWKVGHTPGTNNKPKAIHLGFITKWEQVEKFFFSWIELLKHEINAHDFFLELQKFKPSLQSNNTFEASSNDLFSEDDKIFIIGKINTFKQEVQKIETIKNDVERLNKKMDYLIDRLDKNYPKIDWINIFVGTLVSEGISILKEPDLLDKIKFLFHIITGGKYIN